jgi:ABC-2 type transport system permease protein
VIALGVAATSLRRLVRDRTALFFLLILPVGVILIVGMSMGGSQDLRVGLVDEGGGAEAVAIRRELASSPVLGIVPFDDVEKARTALRRVELDAVVVLPADLTTVGASGGTVRISVIGESTNGTTRAARAAVAAVVAERSAVIGAARAYADRTGASFAAATDAATALADGLPSVEVRTDVVDAESGYLPLGFDYSAPTKLTLFVFVTSLAGGSAMIESRRLGIHGRMLAAPLTAGTIVAGEALSYYAVAVVQSVIIVGLGAFAFGVDWGDPVAALALVTLWLSSAPAPACSPAPPSGRPSRRRRSGSPPASARACSAAACGPSRSWARSCAPSATPSPRRGRSTRGWSSSPTAAASATWRRSWRCSPASPWCCWRWRRAACTTA